MLPERITSQRIRFLLLIFGLLLVSGFFAACGSGNGGNEAAEAVIEDPVTAEGQTIFQRNCASCHSVTGDTIIVGPPLAGIASRASTRVEGQSATDYIQLSILKPDDYIVEGFSDLMPSNFGVTLSGEQLDALVVYLMTLE